jgi:enamine deaminase RidA (YjgF/YER057c/UK114 family)
MRQLAPASVHAPVARYSHAFEVPPGTRLIFCAGQVGMGLDGKVPEGIEAQTEQCFKNIAGILAEGGMSLSDIVRLNVFLVRREDYAPMSAVRDRLIGNPPPASTLLFVAGLARPNLLVEIEATAAKAV